MSQDTDRGAAMEQFRPYLHRYGREKIHDQFPGKLDLSGVVQETLLDAHRAGDRFPTGDWKRQMAYLRHMFDCNLADALRKLGAAKRDVGRERSLEAELEASSAAAEAWLAAEQS